jgi:hypothetical protein
MENIIELINYGNKVKITLTMFDYSINQYYEVYSTIAKLSARQLINGDIEKVAFEKLVDDMKKLGYLHILKELKSDFPYYFEHFFIEL